MKFWFIIPTHFFCGEETRCKAFLGWDRTFLICPLCPLLNKQLVVTNKEVILFCSRVVLTSLSGFSCPEVDGLAGCSSILLGIKIWPAVLWQMHSQMDLKLKCFPEGSVARIWDDSAEWVFLLSGISISWVKQINCNDVFCKPRHWAMTA